MDQERRKPGRPPAKTDTVIELGDNLTKILELVITTNHDELKELLEQIMSAQTDFDEKITRANTALDEVGTAITAEGQQIRDFIAANPSVDTSALEGVVARLEGVNESIAGVFEPEPPEDEPEA